VANRKARWTLVLACVAGSFHLVSAQGGYEEFNAAVHRELRTLDPMAEVILQQADDTRSRGDHRAAADLYKLVLERVPNFAHAMRRGAMEEIALGNRRTALALLEKALALEASAENMSTLAVALIARGGEDSPTESDLARAGDLANRACANKPDDPEALAICAQVALARGDGATLESAVRGLTRVDPNGIATHYLATFAAGARGDVDGALASLERAHAAGLADHVYREIREPLLAARPGGTRLLRLGGVTAAVWLGGALGLFTVGLVLSASAIRMSTRGAVRSGRPAGIDVFTRRMYRAVLFASCVYYYLSMPLLLAVVVIGGGALLYGMVALGHVPIKLFIIVFVLMVVTAWSIVRSLVARGRHQDPGVRIFPDEHRRLWHVLGDVASRVGTRPVEAVYLTPGTEVAVFERGGLWRQLSGRGERSLILGIGVLDGLRLGPLKAVLAHEYGHFSNRDTAGGGLALTVRRSLITLMVGLATSGAAAWYNPVWLFVQGFQHMFLRISQGASRLQEVLADRWAATLYGGQAFEDGLRHVIDRSVRFSAHVNTTLQDTLLRRRPLQNLYRYTPAKPPDPEDLDVQVRAALDADPSPYDSHPRPADRFRWVHALGVDVAESPDDSTPAWELFADRTSMEERMTEVVREAVANVHRT
jgi:Zn-dependent protease with chaperone function